MELTKMEVKALVTKVKVYEMAKKLIVEIMVDIISGVITKLMTGGDPGTHTIDRPMRDRSTVGV